MKNKQTVLIVDDLSDNLDLLVEILDGYDLVTALDGKTALEIVQNEEIDLVLLDIMMPDMDGFEVCEILKNDETTAQIPVIFLSAKGNNQDIEKGFELGAVDYITKPFNPKELISRVDTHLRLRGYEKNLEYRVQEELKKNKIKDQMIYQQSKQAALGELLMHIAHQWKQPLAGLGSINLLARTKLENGIKLSAEQQLENVQKSEELISFMVSTVDTFKNFYSSVPSQSRYYIVDALEKVLNISHATLEYFNIHVHVDNQELESLYGDFNECVQVLFAIINNAIDIFKKRDIQYPKITINIEDRKIVFLDNAGGVEEELLETIFLPYVSSTGGNGIGLHIVKEILEKNGGIISVRNRDEGAEFTVEFLTWMH